MFDFGMSELFVIVFVAIIFIKPANYPELLRKIGGAYGYVIRLYHRFLNEISTMTDFDADTKKELPSFRPTPFQKKSIETKPFKINSSTETKSESSEA
ncbi:hypothetical protein HOG98_01570 [bacterium]|jgi:Sec-independent protein translocase protein TatA|nr:hypothetical protein [bacterium]